ncbi:vesicle transport through interaction with t-SNAREs homolog 1A [Condylostylus longicornis]|uniref:vesicle transport through interaction with t-SNAREs homolog 1A n=1 Tax=Condylostylus longicornis TaxID=2530218 RepID=UPI00244E45DF|nr:vesicle transport through interaction with t-SNAREs homolog 1A [Condylostylus longicornis]
MDWDERSQRIAANTRNILDRTTASIARSQQIAIDAEQVGTEVLSELDDQRESLLRSQQRLQDANDHLSNSARMINSLKRNVLYNKYLLILIILLEVLILIGLTIIKFI